jgi:hypothetical protein
MKNQPRHAHTRSARSVRSENIICIVESIAEFFRWNASMHTGHGSNIKVLLSKK